MRTRRWKMLWQRASHKVFDHLVVIYPFVWKINIVFYWQPHLHTFVQVFRGSTSVGIFFSRCDERLAFTLPLLASFSSRFLLSLRIETWQFKAKQCTYFRSTIFNSVSNHHTFDSKSYIRANITFSDQIRSDVTWSYWAIIVHTICHTKFFHVAFQSVSTGHSPQCLVSDYLNSCVWPKKPMKKVCLFTSKICFESPLSPSTQQQTWQKLQLWACCFRQQRLLAIQGFNWP